MPPSVFPGRRVGLEPSDVLILENVSIREVVGKAMPRRFCDSNGFPLGGHATGLVPVAFSNEVECTTTTQ